MNTRSKNSRTPVSSYEGCGSKSPKTRVAKPAKRRGGTGKSRQVNGVAQTVTDGNPNQKETKLVKEEQPCGSDVNGGLALENGGDNLDKTTKIDTKNFCFFCYKLCSKLANEELTDSHSGKDLNVNTIRIHQRTSNIKFIHLVSRYLRFSAGKLGSEKPETKNVEVSTCDACLNILESFCKLYAKFEELRLQMDWNLTKLGDIMTQAEKVPARSAEFRRIALGESCMGNEERQFMDNFKRLFVTKGAHKRCPEVSVLKVNLNKTATATVINTAEGSSPDVSENTSEVNVAKVQLDVCAKSDDKGTNGMCVGINPSQELKLTSLNKSRRNGFVVNRREVLDLKDQLPNDLALATKRHLKRTKQSIGTHGSAPIKQKKVDSELIDLSQSDEEAIPATPETANEQDSSNVTPFTNGTSNSDIHDEKSTADVVSTNGQQSIPSPVTSSVAETEPPAHEDTSSSTLNSPSPESNSKSNEECTPVTEASTSSSVPEANTGNYDQELKQGLTDQYQAHPEAPDQSSYFMEGPNFNVYNQYTIPVSNSQPIFQVSSEDVSFPEGFSYCSQPLSSTTAFGSEHHEERYVGGTNFYAYPSTSTYFFQPQMSNTNYSTDQATNFHHGNLYDTTPNTYEQHPQEYCSFNVQNNGTGEEDSLEPGLVIISEIEDGDDQEV